MPEPELQLVPPRDSSNDLPKFLAIAFAVMAVVALGVFLLNPRKTAEFTILKAEPYAPHTVSKDAPAGSMHVLGTAPAAEDDLYIVATVRITDKLRLPIFLNGYTAALISPDGTQLNATAIAPRDLARLEETFPALAPMAQPPLDDKSPVLPGEAREGTIVLQFPGLTAAAWNDRKSATLTVNLTHQAPQVATFPAH
jgi:hypothetical protein